MLPLLPPHIFPDFLPHFFHNFSKKSHVQSERGVLDITQMNIFRDSLSPFSTITDRNHTGVSEKASYLPWKSIFLKNSTTNRTAARWTSEISVTEIWKLIRRLRRMDQKYGDLCIFTEVWHVWIHTRVIAQMKRFLILIKSNINHFGQKSIFITFLTPLL